MKAEEKYAAWMQDLMGDTRGGNSARNCQKRRKNTGKAERLKKERKSKFYIFNCVVFFFSGYFSIKGALSIWNLETRLTK